MEPNGLAADEGQLQRGDKLISVNGNTLDGVTHGNTLLLLKNAGENVTLQFSRQVSRSSMNVSLSNSKLTSKQVSMLTLILSGQFSAILPTFSTFMSTFLKLLNIIISFIFHLAI